MAGRGDLNGVPTGRAPRLNTVVLPPVDSSRQAMSLVTGCVVDLDDGCAPMETRLATDGVAGWRAV